MLEIPGHPLHGPKIAPNGSVSKIQSLKMLNTNCTPQRRINHLGTNSAYPAVLLCASIREKEISVLMTWNLSFYVKGCSSRKNLCVFSLGRTIVSLIQPQLNGIISTHLVIIMKGNIAVENICFHFKQIKRNLVADVFI